MTVFHWVRHGPTHQKTIVGWRDVPADLSNTEQIARLDAFLPQDAIIVSSDLRRSHETASAITGTRFRLPSMPGLREFHFGAWDGLPPAQIAQTHKTLSRAYWETPGDVSPPGGESWNMAKARIDAAVDRLAKAYPGKHLIVVAHIGVILTQVQRAMNADARHVIGQKIDNLSVTTIDLSTSPATIPVINHCP